MTPMTPMTPKFDPIYVEHDQPPRAAQHSHGDWYDALRALLARQRDMAGHLRQLAARQASLISAGYGEALLVLLGERQQAIDELLRSQADLAPFVTDMPHRLQALPEGQQAEIRAALDEIAAALDEVLRDDERDQQALHAHRAAARDELGTLKTGRAARDAYVRRSAQGTRFADQHG